MTSPAPRPLSILIAALGGQGGGVLTDWIVAAAEHAGLAAQATSIPGVAQRTGATTYYLEVHPVPVPPGDATPVFSLYPTPGDVDVIMASEYLEAGRTLELDYASPDRTTLVASTHRLFAIGERTVSGDGIFPAERLGEAVRALTRRAITFDALAVARAAGSEVNAVLLGALAASGVLAAPSVLRAQSGAVKIGFLHPVSGALSYSGQQGRIGAVMAIEEINAAGGIKALGGARIEAVLGDAQSTPEGGNAEVEKMNGAGVAAIVGGYASGICLAASQTAARYDLPYIVDVGVVDAIVTRGLKNTFRFGPGFGVIAKTALDNLVTINDQADKAAKTVMIVHEDSAFGAGLAKLLNAQLPERGFQILETIAHPTPTRDFNNVVLKIRAQNPDLVIPANYYNEYVLLARTMQQQRVRPKGMYSVLGGAASSYKFVKEFPEAAQYIMDCNHWFDPKNPKALALKKKIEEKGEFYTYEVYMNYSCVLLLADALERAGGADRAKIIGALESSTFAGHVMPYGPTKFVNGQNQGAAPVNTQVINNDIQVIFPAAFASAKPVFPMPRA